MSGNAGKNPPGKGAPEQPEMTRLESDDEIRQAILARHARLNQKPPAAKAAQAGQPPLATPVAPADSEPQPDRPFLRPPMALLCILDDGKHDGEYVRLRGDRCIIGRTEGDICIPHDTMMSGKHAEIVRQRTAAGSRWMLTDLQSTNGTFVRVGRTILKPRGEVLIGRSRYRLEPAAGDPSADAPAPGGTTQAWGGGPLSSLVPSLVEVLPGGTGQRFALGLPEYWIGRDAQACRIARPDDPLLNARYARLYRDAGGQWHLENNKSLNGLWLRIAEPISLEGACQFRLGEQKFLFRVS